jgi:hypothetical protein
LYCPIKLRTDEPRKTRQKMPGGLSVKDRFTDVIFPDTIDWKGRQPSKKES